MPVHLSPALLLWCILGGLALLVIVMLSAFVRRTLIRRRLILLAQDIAAAPPSTLHTFQPRCEGCFRRRRAMTHYLYGEPVRQAFLCAACEKKIKLYMRQLPSATQGEAFY